MALTPSNPHAPTRRLKTFCLAALLGLACAHAAEDGLANSGLIDLDGDNRISYEEFVHSAAVKAMREMDTDYSGSLSRSEVMTARPVGAGGPAPLVFTNIDSNGDGQVGLDELKKPLAEQPDMKKTFRDLDTNNDGYLSGPELNGFDNGSHERVVPQISIGF
jgi:Ca2+-binding EF-hand superfamily protein